MDFEVDLLGGQKIFYCFVVDFNVGDSQQKLLGVPRLANI